MFLAFCAALESHSIRYAILAGYQGYPDRINSDVDFMVSEADFARLPALLNDPENVAGARLVQILRHETSATYYVLAKQIGEHTAYLFPDAAAASGAMAGSGYAARLFSPHAARHRQDSGYQQQPLNSSITLSSERTRP